MYDAYMYGVSPIEALFIADTCYFYEHVQYVARDYEVAVFVGNTAVDEHRIVLRKQRNIGKFDGSPPVIYHFTSNLLRRFLRTFYVNAVVIERYLDGIESAHGAHGIGDT